MENKNNSISIFINFLLSIMGIVTIVLYNSSIEYSLGLFIILIGFIYVQIERIISMHNKSEKRLLLISGVASGKCGFTTLRAFSPLILRVCGLFRYSKVYVVL